MLIESFIENKESYTINRISRSSIKLAKDKGKKIFKGLIFDNESTGLDPSQSKIIEIGIIPFTFNENFEIVEILWENVYSGLEDPKEPLSDEVKLVTGLNDEMLRDQNIDWEVVQKLLDWAQVAIAHNVAFDAGLLLTKGLKVDNLKFCCSLQDLNWSSFATAKQEFLCLVHGGVYTAHRAIDDCLALLWLLSTSKETIQKYTKNDNSTNYLETLVRNSVKDLFIIKAPFITFHTKDFAKNAGYKYVDKVWEFITSDTDEKEKAISALSHLGKVNIKVIPAKEKHTYKYK